MSWNGTNPADWARKAQAAIIAVKRGSVQALAKEVTTSQSNGGRMPAKTGNMGRSFLIQLDTPVKMAPPGTVFTQTGYTEVLLSLKADEIVYLGFQANYSHRQNYGFVGQDSLGRTYNQSGAGFIEAAAAKWPAIVADISAKVRDRVGG